MSGVLNQEFQNNTEQFLKTHLISNYWLTQKINFEIEKKSIFDFRKKTLYQFSSDNKSVSKTGVDFVCLDLFGNILKSNNQNTFSSNDGIEPGFEAYWCRQGGYCDIPVNSTGIKYMFTPDFSGCSLLVDHFKPDIYRVYHVTGGKFIQEYDNIFDHGVGYAGGVTDDIYWNNDNQDQAFACLKYEEQRWWIYYQTRTSMEVSLVDNQMTGARRTNFLITGGGKIPVANLKNEKKLLGRLLEKYLHKNA